MPLDCVSHTGAVMFDKALAVGTVDEWNVQDRSVFERLLHAVADGQCLLLGLDNGQWQVTAMIENVVRFLALAAHAHLSAHDDAAIGKIHFFSDLMGLPACVLNRRRDITGSSFLFSQVYHQKLTFDGG